MGTLAIRRAYAPPRQSDGERILVDRLWPRGLARGDAAIDEWMKEIAPSAALRKWFDHDPARFAEFVARYRAELDANPAPVQRLCAMVRQSDVTLIFGARNEQFNHARVLEAYLREMGASAVKAD